MSYNFGPFNRDQIIINSLPKSTYNAMGKAIEKMANYGNNASNEGWIWEEENRDFIYAEKTNEMIKGANSLGGGTKVNGVTPNLKSGIDIVYASYF